MTRRLTRCPQGRPLYRHDDLPATLATATMLRRARRAVAPGQTPVASLLYGGHRYAPLYDIGGSAPLAPLPPTKLAAWTARHTCARCAAPADARFGPYVRAVRTGRRLCPACHGREAHAVWTVGQLAARAAAVAWARGVVDNPAAAVLARQHRSDNRLPYRLCALSVAGGMLVDAVIAPRDPYPATVPGAAVPAGAVTVESLLDPLRDIARRRQITWDSTMEHGWLALSYQPIGGLEPERWPALYLAPQDLLGEWYSAWLGETAPRWSYRHATSYGAPQRLAPGSARDHAETMLDLLCRIARDEHPAGPPACPVLADTGVTPCGALAAADGVCPKHRPCPG